LRSRILFQCKHLRLHLVPQATRWTSPSVPQPPVHSCPKSPSFRAPAPGHLCLKPRSHPCPKARSSGDDMTPPEVPSSCPKPRSIRASNHGSRPLLSCSKPRSTFHARRTYLLPLENGSFSRPSSPLSLCTPNFNSLQVLASAARTVTRENRFVCLITGTLEIFSQALEALY
jgi:hypothetical protein